LGRPTADHPLGVFRQDRPSKTQFMERTDLLKKRENPREIGEIVI